MKLNNFLLIAAIAMTWQIENTIGQDNMITGEYPEMSYPAPNTYMTPDGGYAYQGDGPLPMGGDESMYYGAPSEGYCDDGGHCDSLGQRIKRHFESVEIGGWMQTGYHTYNSSFRFNNHADRVRLQQMWVYAEKKANGENGFDLGGRVDYLYGTDAQLTQGFGRDDGSWDTSWDNGIYGFAMPQLYAEAAYGKTTVKAGHFYTIIGYELVMAPYNFFYSHSYSMHNSEPFTHTGALVTHEANDFVTIWGGYVMGWDSGYVDNGDSVLGGLNLVLTKHTTFTYTGVFGRFDENFQNTGRSERGSMHSFIANSEFGKLRHVLWVDMLHSTDQNDAMVRDTFDVNNYFMYQVNDLLSAGIRMEWWNVKRPNSDHADIYALTMGVNITPCDRIVLRPEVRIDWDGDPNPLGVNEVSPLTGMPRSSQTTFGMDAIIRF